jgi:hypothetical protein
MCFGGGGQQAAAAEQQRQNEIARQRQEELNRQAREREAVAAQQQAQMLAMEQEQARAQQAQQEQSAAMQQEQELKVGTIRANGQAVSSSLRILAATKGSQAPTAAVAGRKEQGPTARSTTASLRMGATGRATGAGTNVAV